MDFIAPGKSEEYKLFKWMFDNQDSVQKLIENMKSDEPFDFTRSNELLYQLQKQGLYSTLLFIILLKDEYQILEKFLLEKNSDSVYGKWDNYFITGVLDRYALYYKENPQEIQDYINNYAGEYADFNIQYGEMLTYEEWKEKEYFEWYYICNVPREYVDRNIIIVLEEKFRMLSSLDQRFSVVHDVLMNRFFKDGDGSGIYYLNDDVEAVNKMRSKYEGEGHEK